MVELIIGISAIVGGLYVLSPFLVIGLELSGAPSVVKILATPAPIFALGLVAVLNGIAMVYGIFARNYRVRSIGLFVQILLRLYVIIVVIAAQGLFPLDWLANATLLGVSIVCYLVVRGMIIRNILD